MLHFRAPNAGKRGFKTFQRDKNVLVVECFFLAGPLASVHGSDFETRICLSSGHHALAFFATVPKSASRAGCGWTQALFGPHWANCSESSCQGLRLSFLQFKRFCAPFDRSSEAFEHDVTQVQVHVHVHSRSTVLLRVTSRMSMLRKRRAGDAVKYRTTSS